MGRRKERKQSFDHAFGLKTLESGDLVFMELLSNSFSSQVRIVWMKAMFGLWVSYLPDRDQSGVY